MYNKFKKM